MIDMNQQIVYRFHVFKYVLAILTDKNTKFPRVIKLDEIQKEIPSLTKECLFGFMKNVAGCCYDWSRTILSEGDFNVMWEFQEPNFIQITNAIWRLSGGYNCKIVDIKKK